MRALVGLIAVFTATLAAQTAETIPFRAVLLPSNEVPAVNIAASGAATIWMHVVRDASGKVVSASTDFNVTHTFPGEVRLTGLHIHRGAAGVNGPVVIDSGIRGAEPVVSATGRGTLNYQGQVGPTNTAGLDAVNGVLSNPSDYYVNLHSSENPGGVIRGQLERAEMVVLLGQMSPANEVPPIADSRAAGVGAIIAIATCGGTPMRECTQPTSGQVIFDTNYNGFPEGTSFTGFHIHSGAAGGNGPVTINTGIGSGANAVAANPAGANLHYEVEVPVANAGASNTLRGLFIDPWNYYINLHTAVNPGGAIRAQLRNTDRMQFRVTMSPANEVPAITDVDASAPSVFTAHTIRNSEGAVTSGVAIFDVNYRFPGAETFTGLHIHNERAGANGPVTINTGLSATAPVTTTAGAGNIYRIVNVGTTAGLAALNSLAANPEAHYLNLHTTTKPGGVVRAQLAPASTDLPVVSAVISAVSDPTLRTVAPGGLMTVFGTGFSKTDADIGRAFGGDKLPTSFNGVSITVGGKPAALVVINKDHVIAQVPTDAAQGDQALVVRNANGEARTASTVRVSNFAPALFFGPAGGFFSKLDYSYVDSSNAARPGDMIWTWGTGFGALTGRSAAPALATGDLPAFNALYDTAPVTVTVGGREASVVASVATPGYAGLNQVLFVVPQGVSGNVPVVVTIGGVRSNSVNLTVR
ncbi:MAG TPA: CHRD domain-containing protein [Bryobacteraceae bacterium]|nr:CHRD domain-containing protein [Bryobacteraceae bacterium]